MIDETPNTVNSLRLFPYDPRFTPAVAPTAGVFDAPTFSICVNAEWLSHIDGVIERLAWRDAWRGTPEEQQRAVDETVKILAAIGQAIECGEQTMFRLRQSPSNPCVMEQSFDGGLTWSTAFNYALCSTGGGLTFNVELGLEVINTNTTIYEGNPNDFRPEIQADDSATDAAICHALKLVVRSGLAGLIERKRDEYTQETIFIAVGGVLATATAFLFGGPIAGLGTAIGVAVGLIGNAIIDGVDDDDLQAVLASDVLIDNLVCCAYENLFTTRPTEASFSTSLDGCSLTGAAAAVLPALQALFDDFDVFIQFLDAAGMAHAYATAGVLGNDCFCDEWCYEFDLKTSDGGFTSTRGTWVSGTGWTIQPYPTANCGVYLLRSFPEAYVTDVVVTYDLVAASSTRRLNAWFLDGAVVTNVMNFPSSLETGTAVEKFAMVEQLADGFQVAIDSSTFGGCGASSGAITKIRMTGTGPNPFGSDNC